MMREQHALQQAQQQLPNAMEQDPIGFTCTDPEPFRYHGQLTSVCVEDDRKAFEAFMATVSRDVPLPNGLLESQHGEMMPFDLQNQPHHSITLADNLDTYEPQAPSAKDTSFPPTSHIGQDDEQAVMTAASATVPVPKQPRQLTNWFQPILWTLIDETAQKASRPWRIRECQLICSHTQFGFDKAPLIARHLRETVSPRIFGRLGERQVRKWINTEKSGWKTSVVEKVMRQELLAQIEAGLISVPTGNAIAGDSDGSMIASGDRIGKGAAVETKPATKRSQPVDDRKHALNDTSRGKPQSIDAGSSRRKRRKKDSMVDNHTPTEKEQKHAPLGSRLALDPALL
ncbi:hypothetical protein NCC49_006001 [Naganishia albida]|nr:hypothetical protein NCC49_006001 [Naganishia albida]